MPRNLEPNHDFGQPQDHGHHFRVVQGLAQITLWPDRSSNKPHVFMVIESARPVWSQNCILSHRPRSLDNGSIGLDREER